MRQQRQMMNLRGDYLRTAQKEPMAARRCMYGLTRADTSEKTGDTSERRGRRAVTRTTVLFCSCTVCLFASRCRTCRRAYGQPAATLRSCQSPRSLVIQNRLPAWTPSPRAQRHPLQSSEGPMTGFLEYVFVRSCPLVTRSRPPCAPPASALSAQLLACGRASGRTGAARLGWRS